MPAATLRLKLWRAFSESAIFGPVGSYEPGEAVVPRSTRAKPFRCDDERKALGAESEAADIRRTEYASLAQSKMGKQAQLDELNARVAKEQASAASACVNRIPTCLRPSASQACPRGARTNLILAGASGSRR